MEDRVIQLRKGEVYEMLPTTEVVVRSVRLTSVGDAVPGDMITVKAAQGENNWTPLAIFVVGINEEIPLRWMVPQGIRAQFVVDEGTVDIEITVNMKAISRRMGLWMTTNPGVVTLLAGIGGVTLLWLYLGRASSGVAPGMAPSHP